MDFATFNRLLSAAAKTEASDIHLKTGAPPAIRKSGNLVPIKAPALADDDLMRIAGYLLSQRPDAPDPAHITELDTSYTLEGSARFRVSLYKQRGHLAAVLRIVPFGIPNFEQLHLPKVVERITAEERGMILVTGVAGSGKSSTLAAMVDWINQRYKKHILTIEDPIEFLHADKMSRLSQREVGADTASFSAALRAGLRQDPDVVLIGEMRDLDTIETALKAAETGHLVLATLHTTDAARTISRIIGAFSGDIQHGVRLRLAEVLKAIICQRLVPAADGKGQVLACEILVNTLTTQQMIREPEKMAGIKDYLERGSEVYGTQSFDQHLIQLFRDGKITMETATLAASSPSEIQRVLMIE
jgi:twitching motility protein PilT